MSSKKLTLIELLNLIELEHYRGIINKRSFFKHIKKGLMPKVINDVRGAVRLTVEREGEHFAVVQYSTPLAMETVGEIY